MPDKRIQHIDVGVIDGQVGWQFEYTTGQRESFALPVAVARQFMQGLQELVLIVEHQQAQGTQDATGMSDAVIMQVLPPGDA